MRSTARCYSPGAACRTCRLPVLDGLRADHTESDPADIRGADLDVGDLRRLDQEPPALLVGQGQYARILAQCIGDLLLHLGWRLRTVEDELTRAVRDTDLDLHAANPFLSPKYLKNLLARLVDAPASP